MSKSIAIKDVDLFSKAPIGIPNEKKQPLNMPEERYSPYLSSDITDGKVRNHHPQNKGFSLLEQRIRDILIGNYETATTTENNAEAGDNMDDSTKLLLERIERDSREREARYHKDAQEREQRYREEMKEQDRRLRQEANEREERILNAIAEVKTDLKQDFQDVKDESRTTRNTVIALTVAIIIGIAGMVITVVLTR
ncbi:hypothetical protein [Paenibacillus sp. BJ-4]|uniref:hypothetical protein n=1 Tax=Paenibacillus sp. BJ-4 TaxID=2878097 RepID=UPI001CF05959|nr:hypothetical protein [Paenibacillus sp. BJ-4]